MQRSNAFSLALFILVGGGGCGGGVEVPGDARASGNDLSPPLDMSVASDDLAAPVADLSLPETQDLARARDLAVPPDQVMPPPPPPPLPLEFKNPVNVALDKGAGPFFLATADVDRDGNADVAVVDQPLSRIFILRGRGDGTFWPAQVMPTAPNTSPKALAFGDLDGDGKVDFAFTNANGATTARGDGTGGFAIVSTVTLGVRPRGIAVADLDGDGKLDVVASNSGAINLQVMPGNGRGGLLAPGTTLPTGGLPYGLVTADLDGDGLRDVAVACGNDNLGSVTGVVALHRNTSKPGMFSFAPAAFSLVGNSPLIGIAAVDFDVDGELDVVVANNTSSDVSVLRGAGKGAFAPQLLFAGIGAAPNGLDVADFDLDGHLDIVVASTGGNQVAFLYGNGKGLFPRLAALPLLGTPSVVLAVDLDNNKKPDVVVGNNAGGDVTVLLNKL